MLLSGPHLDCLDSHVLIHEERLTQLREQLRVSPGKVDDPNPKGDPNPKPPLPPKIDRQLDLQREIALHEELVALARDPAALKALGDLANDVDFRRWAARDPEGVARKLGLKVPAGVKLRIQDAGQTGVRMQVVSHQGLYPFLVTWDSERGFSPIRDAVVTNKG